MNISKLISLTLAIMIFALASCGEKTNTSPLLKEQITKENLTEITAEVNKDENFEAVEISLFADGLSRLSQFNDTLYTMTVGDVIESQKSFTRNAVARKALINANGLEMKNSQTLKFKEMKTGTKDTNQYNIVYFDIENLTEKRITEINGSLKFIDNQARVIKEYTIKIKDEGENKAGIPANETKSYDRIYLFNSDNPNDVFIRQNYKSLRILWQPTFIEFSDSTKLTTNILQPNA